MRRILYILKNYPMLEHLESDRKPSSEVKDSIQKALVDSSEVLELYSHLPISNFVNWLSSQTLPGERTFWNWWASSGTLYQNPTLDHPTTTRSLYLQLSASRQTRLLSTYGVSMYSYEWLGDCRRPACWGRAIGVPTPVCMPSTRPLNILLGLVRAPRPYQELWSWSQLGGLCTLG